MLYGKLKIVICLLLVPGFVLSQSDEEYIFVNAVEVAFDGKRDYSCEDRAKFLWGVVDRDKVVALDRMEVMIKIVAYNPARVPVMLNVFNEMKLSAGEDVDTVDKWISCAEGYMSNISDRYEGCV